MRDLVLADADRAIRAKLSAFLSREPAARAAAIEQDARQAAVRMSPRALGAAGVRHELKRLSVETDVRR